MKWFAGLLLLFAFLVAPAEAQMQGTLVQQSPTMLNGCSAINAKGATNAVATATIPALSGQYIYLCGLDFQIVNNATGAVVSTQLCWTTTNLGGAQWCYSAANAANTSTSFGPFSWGFGPVKSAQPGTAVTVVSPAANAQALYNINVYYYYAY